MIAFGVCARPTDRYDTIAAPGIATCRESDSEIIVVHDQQSIFVGYNKILEAARGLEGLEALVLVHDDVELHDRQLCEKLRRLFATEHVGLVGVIGATGVRSLAWWGYN